MNPGDTIDDGWFPASEEGISEQTAAFLSALQELAERTSGDPLNSGTQYFNGVLVAYRDDIDGTRRADYDGTRLWTGFDRSRQIVDLLRDYDEAEVVAAKPHAAAEMATDWLFHSPRRLDRLERRRPTT